MILTLGMTMALAQATVPAQRPALDGLIDRWCAVEQPGRVQSCQKVQRQQATRFISLARQTYDPKQRLIGRCLRRAEEGFAVDWSDAAACMNDEHIRQVTRWKEYTPTAGVVNMNTNWVPINTPPRR